MEIIMHFPTSQFEFVEVREDLSKIDNGKMDEENISLLGDKLKLAIEKMNEVRTGLKSDEERLMKANNAIKEIQDKYPEVRDILVKYK